METMVVLLSSVIRRRLMRAGQCYLITSQLLRLCPQFTGTAGPVGSAPRMSL